MKTYINPQMQIITLQSTTMNCEITSIGGAFGITSPKRSDEQM